KKLDGMGIFKDGGFAEFVKVPRKYLFHIPNNVSTKEALMVESFANAARGVRLSKIDQNEKIVIIGGGNIGLCFLKYILKEKPPQYLVLVEPHEYLRNIAKKMGASEVFPPNKSKIKKYFKDNGSPTFIFDCAGNDKSFLLALDLVERGGTILLEGVYKGNVSFPMFLINSKEVTITGVLGHDYEDINLALNFFSQKKVDANEHITHIMPLNEIQNAFEKFLEPGERKFVKIGIKI
ncbi:MAG: zinc-binding dehydrogenase, partial [Promethearchaeota archaeon]